MRAMMFLMVMAAPAHAGVEIFDCELDPPSLGAVYEAVPCQVTNSLARPVAAVRYQWVATEEARAAPWSESDRPHFMRIDGGIEVGETIRLSFFPPLLSERADHSFVSYRFEVITAFDVNGDPIE